jgi:hypothetical protein
MCMDSRSRPELTPKVHGFLETVKLLNPKLSRSRAMSARAVFARAALGALLPVQARTRMRTKPRATLSRAIALLLVGWLGGSLLAACGADPKTVEGALSLAASAVGARDHEALFHSLDERARFSLASVYQARSLAAQVIRTSYPAAAQASALAELGDAVNAKSDVDLFRARCGDACLDAIAAALGAPSQVQMEDRVALVKTVRGSEARLYRADDGRYGLMWETAALMRERTRAAAELDLIQKNGALYRSQRALQNAQN